MSTKSSLLTIAIVVSITSILSLMLFSMPKNLVQTYAQEEENNITKTNNISDDIIPEAAAAKDAFHIFTAEVEGVDENRLEVSGDTFSQRTIAVNKGQDVTVYFYNLDDVKTERHSFTIEQYNVNLDLGFGEIGKTEFTANQTGIFKYYCKYHPIVMTGQLLVLP